MTQSEYEHLVLPMGTRLFHIGPMKTGTTSLQQILFRQRDELRRYGVLYPGQQKNHRWGIGAFMGARVIAANRRDVVGGRPRRGESDPAVPPMSEWDSLMAELDAGGWSRSVISHEVAAQADEDTVIRLVDAVGKPLHIVVTLRDLASVLPSLWTERLKAGVTEPFDVWLEKAIGINPDKRFHVELQRHLDHAGLVERWASVAGPENVTVVVADSLNPSVIANAFESLLGLPIGLLSSQPLDGFKSNRSLRLAEAEVLRRINEVSKKHSVAWDEYLRLIQRGVVRRWRQGRLPLPDEARVTMPRWALERSQELSIDYADRIQNSGVRIIGDLSSLTRANAPAGDDQNVAEIPIDVAIEALSGLLSASLNRGANFAKPRKAVQSANRMKGAHSDPQERQRSDNQNSTAKKVADTYSTKTIMNALQIRIGHKIQRTRSKAVSRRNKHTAES